ncbi:PaaI family thioesterase [Desulfosarcina ovata]|uniref:Thioesterase n=1 Tax=Desulfosarcina ovata subsp. ovata TaxID=2752305 RepID=A0A5K8AFK2_9BACT|nr:hotdog domain-containing protein [Desulfosarcina ovata]BBO91288.1 thioesterase [Desulfosarcina ovata subsp. ovata]
MNLKTHLAINQSLCGQLLSVDEGVAIVKLDATSEMIVDDYRLVHGGFIFGAADYAAMAAVNHPNVVLGSAEVKFLKPSISGDAIILKATVKEAKGKLRSVDVEGVDEAGAKIFVGVFTCFVLEKHVLEK